MSIKATQKQVFFFFLIQLTAFQVSKSSQMVPVVKNPPAKAGTLRDGVSIPGFGRSPGEGHGKIFQYSFLENAVDKGAGQATVHRVGHDWSDSMHACRYTRKSCFLLLIDRPAPYSSALLAFSHPGHFPEHFSGVHVPLELMLLDCTQSQTQIQTVMLFPLIWMLYSMKS